MGNSAIIPLLSFTFLVCYDFLTHRPGLSFESSITQARNRCCLARENNSEVSDLSGVETASVAYLFQMFYPSRASDNIIFLKGGTPWVQNCM